MFDPEADLNRVHSLVFNDSEILSSLGLSEATAAEKARSIIKRDAWDDLVGSDRRINIYYRPSRTNRNEIVFTEVLQLDVHVPAVEDYLAYRIQKRLNTLINKLKAGTREYIFDGQLGGLSTMPGFFCVGSRYKFHIIN